MEPTLALDAMDNPIVVQWLMPVEFVVAKANAWNALTLTKLVTSALGVYQQILNSETFALDAMVNLLPSERSH
jgi:hypothetical protein